MNLNTNQVIAIIIAVLGVITLSTAQLTDLFGAQIAKYIVSGSAFLGTVLSAVLSNTTNQSATVRAVASMPGVESITVNSQANKILAQVAVDPTLDKIAPTPAAAAAVNALAKGA
jgi:hypothetical protein